MIPQQIGFPGCLCAQLIMIGHSEELVSSSKTRKPLGVVLSALTTGQKNIDNATSLL